MEFSQATMMDLPIQQVIEESRDQMVEGIRYRSQVNVAMMMVMYNDGGR